MDLPHDIIHLLVIVGTILFGNYVGVKVMQVQLKVLTERLSAHENQIQDLYERTRYVMSGHQVRQSIKEGVTDTNVELKELHTMCSQIQTELAIIKARCVGCWSREGDNERNS